MNLRPKTKVLVIKALDGKLYATFDESVFALEKLNTHKESSITFDEQKPHLKQKSIKIPDMTHPWKQDVFENHQRKAWNKLYDTDWDQVYSYEDIWYTQEQLY